MRNAMRVMQMGVLASAMLAVSAVVAAPTQLLLSEGFQNVTGLTTAGTIRTLANIATNSPGQISGAPVATFTNTVNGNAVPASFNVRRDDNAIDGISGSPNFGNTTFDNFFLPIQAIAPIIRNNFLVIGDNAGNLDGSANGGTNAAASSAMRVTFGLAPVTLIDLRNVIIGFDYVFDANNAANPDDFIVDLILADNSVVNLLNLAAPSATTRGSFNVELGPVTSDPFALRFTLIEGTGNGSSAVGIDNIRVTAVPEPGVLALVGLALVGLGLTRRRAG